MDRKCYIERVGLVLLMTAWTFASYLFVRVGTYLIVKSLHVPPWRANAATAVVVCVAILSLLAGCMLQQRCIDQCGVWWRQIALRAKRREDMLLNRRSDKTGP